MNFYAVGFVAVLGVVGLGVDYQQQSIKADLPLGQMSIGAYFDTYDARFMGAKAAKLAEERERQRQADWRSGGLKFLPEAPEGWTRRKYTEGSNTAIMPDGVTYYEEMAKNGTAATMAENLKAQNARKSAAETAKHSWVYERDDEALFIALSPKNKVNDNALGGLISMTMGGFDGISHRQVNGYRVIGGVGFVELPQRTGMAAQMAALTEDSSPKAGFNRAHFRRLTGTVGFNQEIEITVHVNASIESALEILNAVDWDGLNGMLETPMATVGNDVKLPDSMEQEAIAVEMMRLRSQFNALRSQAAQFKLMNANQAALVMNMYSHGSFDLTNGAVPDLGLLIEMGFRKEIRDLMAGRPSENEYQRIRAMMEERPEGERDLPKGEMSEELRDELVGSVAKPEEEASSGFAATATAFLDRLRGKPAAAAKPPKMRRIASKPMSAEQLAKFKEMGSSGIGASVALFEKRAGVPRGSCQFVEQNARVECAVPVEQTAQAAQAARAARAAPVKPGKPVEVRRAGSNKGPKTGGCGAGKFCKAGQ